MKSIRIIKPEQTYNIRKEILRKNINLPYELEGDFDKDSFHLGLFIGDELVTIVTFLKKDSLGLVGNQFQLRAMATIKKFQGKGLGRIIVQEGEDILKNKNVETLWCKARIEAVGFYKSMNYNILGDVFEVPKIGKHYVMFKVLNKKNS